MEKFLKVLKWIVFICLLIVCILHLGFFVLVTEGNGLVGILTGIVLSSLLLSIFGSKVKTNKKSIFSFIFACCMGIGLLFAIALLSQSFSINLTSSMLLFCVAYPFFLSAFFLYLFKKIHFYWVVTAIVSVVCSYMLIWFAF